MRFKAHRDEKERKPHDATDFAREQPDSAFAVALALLDDTPDSDDRDGEDMYLDLGVGD